MTRFVAVMGKGGVGKTTISINLAVSFKNLGKDVILLDYNTINPDVGLFLGTGKLPISLSHVFKNNVSVFETIYLHSSGVKLIPSEGLENASLERLKTVLKSLDGIAEIVLIDTGAFDDELLGLVDEVLIVANPDMMSVSHASKIKKSAEEKGITVLGVVLNKFYNYGLPVEDFEHIIEMPALTYINDSNDLKIASLNKQAVVNYYPRADISKRFNYLAKQLSGKLIEKEGFFDYILKGIGLK
jgi:flagellar biosynthesis protein FlhG